ncbi:MAG TPA: hypothetical protein VES88_15935 [Gemmatimonadaceae bacterium]|nr:hypothetical protein [Gemmatimonadaceae bacterium]
MHIEFIDLLRCPNAHEDSWLVAAFYRMDGRMVVEGKLGCPVCGAEYFIRDGVAVFDEDHGSLHRSPVGDAETDGTEIAALLNLAGPGMLALLAGEWARDAQAVSELTGARIIALNSPSRLSDSDAIAEVHARLPIPIAAHSLDGIAFDAAHATPALLSEAARLLRPRGRLLVRGQARLSDAFHELARDRDQVVAEYVGELVSLRR